MKNKIVIIDGSSIFYRSFYALPLLSNTNGEYSNAVYGFAIQILNIIENIKPTHIAVAFDAAKKTFRNDIFEGYKATRKPMPNELRSQLEPLKKMLKLMNIALVEKEGIEGDDVIGILSDKFADNSETIIVTGDRDSFQLIDNDTKVYFTKRGTSELKIMGLQELKNEYGVSPKQFIDVKALQGDKSDNIPGVAGVGEKTATELILRFGSLDGVYNHIDEITGKVQENLKNNKNDAFMSKELATILRKGYLNVSLDDLKYDYPFNNNVLEFFKYYEFRTLIKRQEIFNGVKEVKLQNKYNIKNYAKKEELQNLASEIEKTGKFSIYINNNDIHISYGKDECLIHLNTNLLMEGVDESDFYEVFKSLFTSTKITKVVADSKKLMYVLKQYSINLENYFDVAIAKSLVDGVSVDSASDIFGYDFEANIACSLFEIEDEYKNKIERNNLHFLYYEVEIPLVKVLFSMENDGFNIDRQILDSLSEKYSSELESLTITIYELAGDKFNINSPKQLANILFDKLGLPKVKGDSTSAEHLEKLKNKNEIINYILRYRKVSKFLNTYVTGMYPHISSDGKVHTYFKQTLTTTGRLSSVEPNLQNIPIRSSESREIRSMFVASSEDNVLVDADYSQIELRLLAHLSKDPVFIDAFNNNQDIHTKTASEVFGVDDSVVTKEMRRTAKIVNFGIIYGISGFGLAEDLNIKQSEAKAYIDHFYNLHPEVKKYMDNSIETAKQTGYATTLFGRKRRMDDINVSNYMVRMRAERASQNMPLQGTAADIIKIAMVNTYNALHKENLKAKLIMQVHDELIIDCPKNEKDRVIKILTKEMENACDLVVPLVVDVSSSYRWSDTH